MASETLLVREVAERLGLGRADIYGLIRTGALDGQPDPTGEMQITVESVERYEQPRAPR